MTWVSPALNESEAVKLAAFEEGIPPYMRKAVVDWVVSITGAYTPDKQLLGLMTLALKQTFPAHRGGMEAYLVRLDDHILVTVLDWLLYHIPDAKQKSKNLEIILRIGRSEWAVVSLEEGQPRIARRIPEGVMANLKELVGSSTLAGSLLAESFNAIYGPTPNPDHAYGLSVKAVETLACPKFLPKNTRATLSQVFAHLERKEVSLPLREANAPDKELIVSMMRKLFNGAERHGSETYEHVSLDGAKTAFSLATALLTLLSEDLITIT